MKFPGQLLLAVLLALNAPSLRAADDPFAWPAITAQTRPWTYWWWMGSAVDKTNITRELERYHAAGLGGVHIIPIYGAKGFEDKYIKYLSPEWMEMMGWTVSEANRLGMGVDLTTGTGWCFGGPQVTDEDANASVVVRVIDIEKDKPWKMPADLKNIQACVAYSPDGKSRDLTDVVTNAGYGGFRPRRTPRHVNDLHHLSKTFRPESQTPRAWRRRLDAQPHLSARDG